MEMVLAGKTALVTGGSRGIGAAISHQLAGLGANVVVNYCNSRERAESVVEAITKEGGEGVAVCADVSKVAEIKTLFAKAIERFGRLDILVNNAGMLMNKPISEVSEQEYDALMALNLKSVFFACREAAKRMEEGGRIINISSTVTRMLLPTYGLYAASKGGVEQITRVLAKELGSRNISVNSLSPGPVDTELFREGKTEAQVDQMAAMAAFGRIGTPQDIAAAISLLVCDESAWITGQNICANGGMAG